MTTYEIIPQSKATSAEFEFLKFVHATSKTLVSKAGVASAMSVSNFAPLSYAIPEVFVGVSVEGLRPAWLNTMSDLHNLHASLERHKVSQHSTFCDEASSLLYAYALWLVEGAR